MRLHSRWTEIVWTYVGQSQLSESSTGIGALSDWNHKTSALAAKGGHLEVLKWAWSINARGMRSTCGRAATGGQL